MIIRSICALALVCALSAQTHIVTSQSTATGSAIDHSNATVTLPRSGNTSTYATVGSTRTAGKQVRFDADGNLEASTYDVGAAGGGTGNEMLYTTSGTAPGSTACTPGRDVWLQTGLSGNNARAWICKVSGTWARQLIASSGTGAPAGTACDQADEFGDTYDRTDATQRGQSFYRCGKDNAGNYGWELIAAPPASFRLGDNTVLADVTTGERLITATESWVAPAGEVIFDGQVMPMAGTLDQAQLVIRCGTAANLVSAALYSVRKNGVEAASIAANTIFNAQNEIITGVLDIPFVAGDRFTVGINVITVGTTAKNCKVYAMLRGRAL